MANDCSGFDLWAGQGTELFCQKNGSLSLLAGSGGSLQRGWQLGTAAAASRPLQVLGSLVLGFVPRMNPLPRSAVTSPHPCEPSSPAASEIQLSWVWLWPSSTTQPSSSITARAAPPPPCPIPMGTHKHHKAVQLGLQGSIQPSFRSIIIVLT